MADNYPGYVALDDLDPPAEPEAPLPDVPPGESAIEPKPVVFKPTVYAWRPPSQIPRRRFIYGKHLTRGTVSATVAPGGVGKSSSKLVDAVAMAAGRDLLGDKPVAPLRVWYINLEDDWEEIERHVAAICLYFRIKPEDIAGRLYFEGRDTCKICVAKQTNEGARIAVPVIDGLTAALKDTFDVLIIDPFVSAHNVSENDNGATDLVVKALAGVAGAADAAIELVHHSRKTNGAEITSEDSRGGSATVAATRSTRVLNRMDANLAKTLGIDDKTRRRTFRLDNDKLNLAPPQDARWFQIQNVGLGNGSGGLIDDQDYVGVVDRWNLPNAFDGVSTTDLRAVQEKVAAGRYRDSSQSDDWVGRAVADVLSLDVGDAGGKSKINGLLKAWTKNRMFKVVERLDEARRTRKFIEVDQWAN